MSAAWEEVFQRERGRLFGIAYRILGSAADAEDVLQEAWIACADRADVDDPAAYATRAVGSRALNRLRDTARRRETYPGPWLPEPVAADASPDESALMAESLTMAMLVMMERLSPLERAAFVLCEVFDVPAPEAAAALERTPAAVRQLVSRARRRLREDAPPMAATPAEHTRVTREFGLAVASGDVGRVVALLAPDVVMVADGGGKALAAGAPLEGAPRVAQVLLALAAHAPDAVPWEAAINGRAGFVIASASRGPSVYQLDVRDGLVSRIWAVRNPDKLSRVPLEPPRQRDPGRDQ